MHVTFAFVSAARKERQERLESEFETTATIALISDLSTRVSERVKAAHEHVAREFGGQGSGHVE